MKVIQNTNSDCTKTFEIILQKPSKSKRSHETLEHKQKLRIKNIYIYGDSRALEAVVV